MADPTSQAEELVHDAFARLYERWDRVDKPGGYLRTCVVNGCKDRLRRRAVERRHDVGSRPTPPSPPTTTWPTCWPSCPTGSGPPSSSAYYEDRSEADIAELLGVRPGTVKSLLHRGLAHLREVLEP